MTDFNTQWGCNHPDGKDARQLGAYDKTQIKETDADCGAPKISPSDWTRSGSFDSKEGFAPLTYSGNFTAEELRAINLRTNGGDVLTGESQGHHSPTADFEQQ